MPRRRGTGLAATSVVVLTAFLLAAVGGPGDLRHVTDLRGAPVPTITDDHAPGSRCPADKLRSGISLDLGLDTLETGRLLPAAQPEDARRMRWSELDRCRPGHSNPIHRPPQAAA